MEAKIAVATVSGKAYYFLVNELKARRIDFLSLTPYENIPLNIEVVITTQAESKHIKHPKILTYEENTNPAHLVDEAIKLMKGQKAFETIIVGIDPGKTFGIAVLSNGNILETLTCESADEAVEAALQILNKHQAAERILKVGSGPQSYTDEVLPKLDAALAKDVIIEIVREAGTSRFIGQATHTRNARHTMAAIKIAERHGQTYQRGASEKK